MVVPIPMTEARTEIGADLPGQLERYVVDAKVRDIVDPIKFDLNVTRLAL